MSVSPLPVPETGSKLRQYVDQLLSQRDRVKGEQDHYTAIIAAAVADGFDIFEHWGAQRGPQGEKALQELIKRLVADETTVKKDRKAQSCGELR
jgi:hypothetical protein